MRWSELNSFPILEMVWKEGCSNGMLYWSRESKEESGGGYSSAPEENELFVSPRPSSGEGERSAGEGKDDWY